jgi:hypothetical protein
LGAIPWVILQLLLVVVVIFVPETVTAFLDKVESVDLDKVQIEMPVDELANTNDDDRITDILEQKKPDEPKN